MMFSQGGYDHLIGTSEHGLIVNSSQLTLPAFRYIFVHIRPFRYDLLVKLVIL